MNYRNIVLAAAGALALAACQKVPEQGNNSTDGTPTRYTPPPSR